MSKYEEAAKFKEDLPDLKHRLYELRERIRISEDRSGNGNLMLREPNTSTREFGISFFSDPSFLNRESAEYLVKAIKSKWHDICKEAGKIADKEFEELLLEAKEEIAAIQKQLKDVEKKREAEGDGRKVRP